MSLFLASASSSNYCDEQAGNIVADYKSRIASSCRRPLVLFALAFAAGDASVSLTYKRAMRDSHTHAHTPKVSLFRASLGFTSEGRMPITEVE